jgi:hypothetical protein
MNGQEIMDLLNLTSDFLQSKYPFVRNKIVLLKELDYMNSRVLIDGQCDAYVIEVGVGGLNENSDYSDYDMMIPLVGMFHEVVGHVRQLNMAKHENSELYKVIALNYFACLSSMHYYNGKNLRQYFNQPSEIAAQYSGIEGAYEFCTDLYGKERASDLICNYVNNRIKNKSEFIKGQFGRQYTNVDDILSDFNSTFKKSMYAHRKFDMVESLKCHDTSTYYFKINGDISKPKLLERERNGAKQDLILSAIYLYEKDYSGYLRENVAALEDAASIDSVFDKSWYPNWMRVKSKDIDLSDLIDNEYQDDNEYDVFS